MKESIVVRLNKIGIPVEYFPVTYLQEMTRPSASIIYQSLSQSC